MEVEVTCPPPPRVVLGKPFVVKLELHCFGFTKAASLLSRITVSWQAKGDTVTTGNEADLKIIPSNSVSCVFLCLCVEKTHLVLLEQEFICLVTLKGDKKDSIIFSKSFNLTVLPSSVYMRGISIRTLVKVDSNTMKIHGTGFYFPAFLFLGDIPATIIRQTPTSIVFTLDDNPEEELLTAYIGGQCIIFDGFDTLDSFDLQSTFDARQGEWIYPSEMFERYLCNFLGGDSCQWIEERWDRAHVAASFGKIAFLQYLLSNVHVDIQDCFGATPLHYASWGGKWKVVEMLLDKGANIFAVDEDNSTCLHAAAYAGNFQTMKYLLNHYKSNDNSEPLSSSSSSSAWLRTQNSDGESALHLVVLSRSVDCLLALVEAGADTQIKDLRGLTAFDWAILHNWEEAKSLLSPPSPVARLPTPPTPPPKPKPSVSKLAKPKPKSSTAPKAIPKIKSSTDSSSLADSSSPPTTPPSSASYSAQSSSRR